jgi:C-terminal processing protease CtpA/Prc
MFASMAKYYSIATLVGEETGDATACYGDTLHFSLPNSKLQIVVACKYFVNVGGKPDGHGVIPDCEVKQTRDDTAKGVDTVLQFTLNLIKSHPQQPTTPPSSQRSGVQ